MGQANKRKRAEATRRADRVLTWKASLGSDGQFLPRGSEEALEGGWDLTLRFTQVGERLYPSHLELHPGTFQEEVPVGGITARLLHRIKLGALVDAFSQEQQGDMAAQELFFGRRSRPRYQLPPKTNRAGPEGWGEVFYQDVAVAYVQALQISPRRPIDGMSRFYRGYTKTNVRDRVARAREKGYLTASAQGRAGGEATKKLKDALRARGTSRPLKARPQGR